MTPLEIEIATAIGWPARHEACIAGWRVFTGLGSVGRVNSTWPLEFDGSDVERAIDAVEAHYLAKGLFPQFKLASGLTKPSDLSERLVKRNYIVKNKTLVMTCENSLKPPKQFVHISQDANDQFTEVIDETSTDLNDARERSDILTRLPLHSAFGMIENDGKAAAVGLATFTGSSAGIASMRTRLQFRKRGYARSILRAVAATARQSGARTLWLQVEADNAAAIALYKAEGFSTIYSYQTWRCAT
jgi:N-acetylglutamate synthase